ncbi:recombination mediator RecR [Bartonella sp. DGB1]|uniref:recombination mediator RecR n=1 Tax=Bartonella sp. DGB1 TaxID=3239807 RepID=UPI003523EF76
MKPDTTNNDVEQLIKHLAKLPGLGPRSARRAALYLLKQKDLLLFPLLKTLEFTYNNVKDCEKCGNIDTSNICSICQDPKRNKKLLIVVENVADLWAIERSSNISALYHVLGGALSPLDGIRPQDLRIEQLFTRLEQENMEEVILALNATIEGQTTIHYLTEKLEKLPVKLSKLAHGVPVGGELDYLDSNTLTMALQARTLL